MHYVYILRSTRFPTKTYVGISQHLASRLKSHNAGRSPHTARFKPWKIIFYAAFPNRQTASNFEKYLKTSSGIAFRNKRLI